MSTRTAPRPPAVDAAVEAVVSNPEHADRVVAALPVTEFAAFVRTLVGAEDQRWRRSPDPARVRLALTAVGNFLNARTRMLEQWPPMEEVIPVLRRAVLTARLDRPHRLAYAAFLARLEGDLSPPDWHGAWRRIQVSAATELSSMPVILPPVDRLRDHNFVLAIAPDDAPEVVARLTEACILQRDAGVACLRRVAMAADAAIVAIPALSEGIRSALADRLEANAVDVLPASLRRLVEGMDLFQFLNYPDGYFHGLIEGSWPPGRGADNVMARVQSGAARIARDLALLPITSGDTLFQQRLDSAVRAMGELSDTAGRVLADALALEMARQIPGARLLGMACPDLQPALRRQGLVRPGASANTRTEHVAPTVANAVSLVA